MKVEEKKWARSNGLSASASAPAPADVRGNGATEGSETAIEATSDAPRRGRLILRAAIYAVIVLVVIGAVYFVTRGKGDVASTAAGHGWRGNGRRRSG